MSPIHGASQGQEMQPSEEQSEEDREKNRQALSKLSLDQV